MNMKHLQGPYKHVFLSEEEIKAELKLMEKDVSLNTKPGYMRDAESAICLVTFKEKHSVYLKQHPKINPQHYLSNLKTGLRIRP